MAPPRRRSQLDQLYSDGSSSRLDPNPGLDEATTDATRRRVAVGRADRVIAKGLRSNDPKMQAWAVEQTLERSKTPGWEGPPAGITKHGQFDQKDRSSAQERIERGLQMKNGGSRPEDQAPQNPAPGQAPVQAEPQRTANPNANPTAGYGNDGYGQQSSGTRLQGRDANGKPKNAGTTADRADLASTAGSTAPRGSSDTRPATASPALQGESGNASSLDNGLSDPDDWRGIRNKAVQDQVRQNKISKFGADLMNAGSSGKTRTSDEWDSIFEYGDSLGITRDQARAQIEKGIAGAAKGDNPPEIDPKYAVSDEQGSAMDKAGINGKPEKKLTQADIELEKIKKDPRLSQPTGKDALLVAKQRAAARTGYTGKVTADTDFGAEVKAAIPEAKNAMQSLIDAGDLVPGSESNPSLQKSIQELKERRGAAMFGQTQMDIVNQAPSITSEKGESVDPLLTGNPLFDNPNADSASWANPPKTSQPKASDKPAQNSSGTPTKELSASFQDQPFTSPDPIKPWLMGDSGKSNKPTEKAWYDKKASEVFQAPQFLKGTMIGGVIDSIGEFAKPNNKKAVGKGIPIKNEEEERSHQISYNNSQRMRKELQGHSDLMTRMLT